MANVIQNGMDAKRHERLSPITSITRGYDSPAASVIAHENGCQKGVAIDVEVYGVQDSGKEIADQLGLAVTEYPHIAGAKLDTLLIDYTSDLQDLANEFIATVGHGDDVSFKSFEDALHGAIFFSGVMGDNVWDKSSKIFPGMPIRTVYGKSLNEFRLRVGFAHVAVPSIGAMYPRSIVKISNSREMRRFSVKNSYDRPIPRRIIEEAGVARESFGNLKCATAPDSQNRRQLWPTAMEKMVEQYQTALG